MKITVIGDIHGSPKWKEVVKNESDLYIFVGDYFDSFEYSAVEQLHNFKEIVKFKKAFNDKVILLLGNHDYWPNGWHNEQTSGYQAKHKYQFEFEFKENKELFKICHIQNDIIFTHAGVSHEYLKRLNYINEPIDEFLNDYLKYRPYAFKFASVINENESCDSYGDNIFQGPTWIREKSLIKANKNSNIKKNYIQVFGHTPTFKIDLKGKATGGRYYNADILNTISQYLIITDGIFSVGKI